MDSNFQSPTHIYNTHTALLVPTVVERTNRGERSFDIFSRLLREHLIILGSPIDDTLASLVIAQLLYLDSENPERDISIYINSPGGSITAGLAIYDAMHAVHADVSTFCLGLSASMATILLAGGTKGKRFCLPNSTVHMHPAGIGQIAGNAPDIDIHARELLREQQLIRELLARDTGQSLERIATDFDRDMYMNAAQAVAYGIVDGILQTNTSTSDGTGSTIT